MMSSDPRSQASPVPPIVEFLGEDAGIGGPFALLGLLHDVSSDQQIIRACNRRLHQIDRHRHSSTPDADEVRLAVHAAGSQLLDKKLRVQLVKRWPPGVPVLVPKAWQPKAQASRVSPAFIQRARLLIGASGGWNANARKRLAYFARVNRVTALEIVRALSPASQTDQKTQQLNPKLLKKPKLDRVHLIDPPGSQSLQWFAAFAVLAVMGGAIAISMLYQPPAFSTDFSEAEQASTAGVEEQDSRNPGATSGSPDELNPTRMREEITHYTAIAHELDQLVRHAESEPEESIEQFKEIYAAFIESWTAFPIPALERSGFHMSEFVKRVPEDDQLLADLYGAMACVQIENEPARSMLQISLFDLILSDSQLSSNKRQRLEQARNQCAGSGARPTTALLNSLITVGGLIGVESQTDHPDWWRNWGEGIGAITANDPEQRTRLVLSAMTARLRDQSVPTQDWKQSVVGLVNSVSWSSGSPERVWLLSQFADEAVSTHRLAALTEALATQSSAQSVTTQMVLNPSATFIQRQELAKVYRSVWDKDSEDQQNQFSANTGSSVITTELRLENATVSTKMSEKDAIETIIRLAKLNTAASCFNRSDLVAYEEIMQRLDEGIGGQRAPAVLKLNMNHRDTQWAESAMNVESVNELSSLFARLVQDDGPGANSAHALVYLASVHSDSEIRSLASAQIERYKNRATVLLAIDHAITGSRITSRLEKLVISVIDQPLPPRTDDSWYSHAHQAIVLATASALANSYESQRSLLAQQLEVAYADRLSEAFPQSDRSVTDHIAQYCRELLYELMIHDSYQGISKERLEYINAQISVSIARANSPMHAFYAYQRGLVQLRGLHIEYLLPGSQFRVSDILSEFNTRSAQCGTVLEQIAQAERCLAELWILQLEGRSP